MPVEVSQILSIISCLVACMALVRNVKGDTKADAGQTTEMIVKLEIIKDDLKEIKNDMKEIKDDMQSIKERLVIVEQSVKSAHHRIDTLQGKHHDDPKE